MPAPFDAISLFDKKFKPDKGGQEFDEADEKRLKNRLPDTLLKLLRRDGFVSYNKGLIWTCDPDLWNGAGQPWKPNEKAFEVFMRTSFGDLFIWDGEWIWFAIVHEADVGFCVQDIDWFFGRYIVDKGFLPASGIPADTKRAIQQKGGLASDECYFWTPELMLGGSKMDSSIEKGDYKVMLSMLAQLDTPVVQPV